MGLPDLAPEHPAEEPKAPATVRKLYAPFTYVAHLFMPSGKTSDNHGGGEGENAGNIPAGLYNERTISMLLDAVNVKASQASL